MFTTGKCVRVNAKTTNIHIFENNVLNLCSYVGTRHKNWISSSFVSITTRTSNIIYLRIVVARDLKANLNNAEVITGFKKTQILNLTLISYANPTMAFVQQVCRGDMCDDI